MMILINWFKSYKLTLATTSLETSSLLCYFYLISVFGVGLNGFRCLSGLKRLSGLSGLSDRFI
jgi:hypothetical protein